MVALVAANRGAPCAQLYCWQPSAGSTVPPGGSTAAAYFERDQRARVKTHLRRMRNLTTTAFEKLAPKGGGSDDDDTREDDSGGDVEAAFPYLWLGLQEAVAVTEKAGSDADAWHAVVKQLVQVFEKRVLNQVKLRTVAEYMRKTLSLRRSATRAASYLKWLRAVPELAGEPEFVDEIRAFVALLEQEVKTGDVRFDGNAEDLFLPSMPQLLSSSNVEKTTRDSMTTYSLWPTRISIVPLAKRYAWADSAAGSFNRLLSTAAVEARNTFARRSGQANPSAINNGFFQAQYEVEYSYFNSRLQWCREKDTDCKLRGKGLRMFGNTAQQRAVEQLMQLAHEQCVEHTLRSGGARAQTKSMFKRSTLFIWAAVYTAGTDHSAHMHEDAMCSGVYYSRSAAGSSPITFSDPRGTDKLKLLLGQGGRLPEDEKQFEPRAPFHHQYSFLPKQGDMVLFPSFTAHEVPANIFDKRDASRIVWAFNLHGEFESWARANA